MIETITAITLCVLYLVFFRPGKTPRLENPLLIERQGRYRITIAPKLNLAQPFIESVAARISIEKQALSSSTVQFFAVRDKQVGSHALDGFLLVAGYRNGMLYFQAEQPPRLAKSHSDWLTEFTRDVLANAPARNTYSETLDSLIISAMQSAASELGVDVMLLHAAGMAIRQQPLTSLSKPFEFCK